METARQVLRWGIPGWTLFLGLGLFFIIGFEFHQDFPAVGAVLSSSSVLERTVPVLTATATALGIPIGFIIFQLYYVSFWRGVTFLRTSPQDKGYCVFCGFDVDDYLLSHYGRVPVHAQTAPDSLPTKSRPLALGGWLLDHMPIFRKTEISDKYRWNWYLADCVWSDLTRERDFEPVVKKAIWLSDTFHCLGAARLSMVMAFVMYAAYRMIGIENGWPSLARSLYKTSSDWKLVAVCAGLTFGFYWIASATRTDSLHNLLALMKFVLRRHLIEQKKEEGLGLKNPFPKSCDRCQLGYWQESTIRGEPVAQPGMTGLSVPTTAAVPAETRN